MANLVACSTRALCASRPPLPAHRAIHQARRRSVRGVRVVAAAAADPPPPAAGGDGDACGSGARPPSARELARQQRVRQQAQDARLEIQQRGVGAPRSRRYSRTAPRWPGLNEQTAQQIEAVAAELLAAGMTKAAVVKLLDSQHDIVTLEPQALAPKLASVRAFLRGESCLIQLLCMHAELPPMAEASSDGGRHGCQTITIG